MKKSKVIIPAMAMILFSTAASITGTVAWFSLNRTVTVTGMQVKTKVSNNLFIGGDTFDSTAKLDEDDFENSLTQSVKGFLEPVSTVNGKNFFYTSAANAKADGSVIAAEYIAYDPSAAATVPATYGNKFSEDYGVTKTDVTAFTASAVDTAVGYVDYVFQLKAINTLASPYYINITKMNLIYEDAVDESRSHRLAMFVENITSANPTGDLSASTGNIYTPGSAANFTDGKAVNAVDGLGTVTYVSSATPIATVAANSTGYYKVVARLWLEGEDDTCNNQTFMALTNNWSLDLEMQLDSSSASSAAHIAKFVKGGSYYHAGGQYAWPAANKDELGDTSSEHAIDLHDTASGTVRLAVWEQVKGTLGAAAGGYRQIGATNYYVKEGAEDAGAIVYNNLEAPQYGHVYGGAA